MYVPAHFRQSDTAILLEFMRAHLFATLVTADANLPFATHLPFLVIEKGDNLCLLTHLAIKNPQVQHLQTTQEVLTIFQSPHAYISPSLYEKNQNVPTWNYVAVHAYGIPQLIIDSNAKRALLVQQMTTYEPNYLQQWKTLDESYIKALLSGIIALEITVTRIEGKEKLSQNKTSTERQNIIESLRHSPDTPAQELGAYMEKKYSEK